MRRPGRRRSADAPAGPLGRWWGRSDVGSTVVVRDGDDASRISEAGELWAASAGSTAARTQIRMALRRGAQV